MGHSQERWGTWGYSYHSVECPGNEFRSVNLDPTLSIYQHWISFCLTQNFTRSCPSFKGVDCARLEERSDWGSSSFSLKGGLFRFERDSETFTGRWHVIEMNASSSVLTRSIGSGTRVERLGKYIDHSINSSSISTRLALDTPTITTIHLLPP